MIRAIFLILRRHALTLALALLCGILAVAALAFRLELVRTLENEARTSATARIFEERRTYTPTLYGIVQSVDTRTGNLVVTVHEPYEPSSADVNVTIHFDTSTIIAEQRLQGQGDVFTSLSDLRRADPGEIRAGDRVAISAIRKDNGTLTALQILFGNPI